jgi:type II secretory pathway component PulF
MSAEPAKPLTPGASPGRPSHAPIAVFSPASREPLSVEAAVLGRSMALLKREAADSLAALGAAHALVTSARLAQVQHLREQVERGEENAEALTALAADYQGWQNDQVRLFDAMALVLRMGVPMVTALEVIEPQLHDQARAHLASLSAEYQRGLLMEQFRDSPLNS